jgi:hypothetical protein
MKKIVLALLFIVLACPAMALLPGSGGVHPYSISDCPWLSASDPLPYFDTDRCL